MLKRKTIGGVFAAVAAAALLTGSVAGVANAGAIMPAHQQGSASGPNMPQPQPPSGPHPWYGYQHDGQWDPADPHHNDWHCDRWGYWHNNHGDAYGHFDQRCHQW